MTLTPNIKTNREGDGVPSGRAHKSDELETPAARRERIQKVFIRVCGDAGFKMDMAQAAYVAGKLIGVSPLEFWIALGIDGMERIANGTHPALLNPRYADDWARARAEQIQAPAKASKGPSNPASHQSLPGEE